MGRAKILHYYRHPRTQQEKMSYYDSVDQGVVIRAKRAPVSLPDTWDDIQYSRRRDKSWKLSRCSQWVTDNRDTCEKCANFYKYCAGKFGTCHVYDRSWKTVRLCYMTKNTEYCEMFDRRK